MPKAEVNEILIMKDRYKLFRSKYPGQNVVIIIILREVKLIKKSTNVGFC